MLATALASAGFPWSRPPPPPPPPEPFTLLPTLAAVTICWVAPAVLYGLGQITLPSGLPTLLKKLSSDSAEPAKNGAAKPPPHRGVLLLSIAIFTAVSASAVTFPFMQTRRDALGCDALCQGGQTSLRSGLALVGAALIGRASDRFGRAPMLWLGTAASLLSLGINGWLDTLSGMWLSIVPLALLNQNFSVAKALVSDYIDEQGGSDAERAGAVGKLGMALGFSFMAGPLLATLLVKSYTQALRLSAIGILLSAVLLLMLPAPKPAPKPVPNGTNGANGNGLAKWWSSFTKKENGTSKPGLSHSPSVGGTLSAHAPPSGAHKADGLRGFLTMPVLRTRGAQLLMALRLLMALAFHMFMPVRQASIEPCCSRDPRSHAPPSNPQVWQVSIKTRFDFGPSDHAKFMGLIGLTYALSQGLVAKPLIKTFEKDPTKLLLCCILFLGGARPFALWTSSILVVYALYVPMVISLGVMNTAITSACSNLAEGDQLGGLFGVLESVESVAGIVGPSLGGALSAYGGPSGALAAVVSCYSLAFGITAAFFKREVSDAAKAKAK